MAPYVVAEIAEKVQNPLSFQWDSAVAEVPPAAVKGYDAALLIDLCNCIAAANAAGALKGSRYSQIVPNHYRKMPAIG